MDWFANYHYFFVHFPIALVIMAGIAEFIMAVRKKDTLDNTVLFLLGFSVVFTLFAIASGLSLEDVVSIGEKNHDNLEWHESFAFSTLFFVVAALVIRLWKGKNILYFFLLILSVISVCITAHFGGLMAFGPLQYLPF